AVLGGADWKLRFWNSPAISTSVLLFMAKPNPAPRPQMLRPLLPLPSAVPAATSFEMNERFRRRPRLPVPILWPHITSNASPFVLGSPNVLASAVLVTDPNAVGWHSVGWN